MAVDEGTLALTVGSALGGGGIGGVLARAWLGGRRIDRVDSVTAIAQAFEIAQRATERHVEALQDTMREQSRRIDTLENLVLEKDRALGERDRTIRRLRDLVEAQRVALASAGVDAPPVPVAPGIAPDRRNPDAHDLAEYAVDVAQTAAQGQQAADPV